MDEEEKGGSNEPTPPCAGAAPKSRRKARNKPKRKTSPKQAGAGVNFNAPTKSSLSQINRGSLASLETEHLKKDPTSEKDTKEDEKLTEDINYILNDDVGADESNGQISSGKISPTKKAKRLKNYCSKEQRQISSGKTLNQDDVNVAKSDEQIYSERVSPTKGTQRLKKYSTNADDEELANDIAFILSDDIIAVQSNGHMLSGVASATTRSPQNPKKDLAKKQKNTDEKELPKNVDTTLTDVFSDNSTPESSSMANPQRLKNHSISEKEAMNDQKLEDDIAFILNDDITAPESGTAPPKRKVRSLIKPLVREKKRTDDKKLAESNRQIASGDVSQKKPVSFQETNEADDKLAKDIEYILNDDIVEVACNEKMSSSLGALPSPKKITFTEKHCTQDELEKDIQYILNDDISADESNDDEVFSSPSEIPRPKTSNPKLTLAMDMDRIFDPEPTASPSQADDKLEEDIAYILSDNILDVPSSGPMPFRSGGTRRLKKQSVRKSKETADLSKKTTHATCKLVKDYSVEGTPTAKTLRSACAAASTNKNSTDKSKDVLIFEDVDSSAHIYFDSGYSVVPRSPKNSSCEQKRAKIGEKADDKLEDNKNLASIGSINSSSSVGTPFKAKYPTRQPNYKTEKVNWEEAIDKILGMSKGDSDASRENLSDGGIPLRQKKVTRKPKQSDRTEEDNLEEAINEILEIPTADSGASGKNLTASGTSLRKHPARQPKRSKHTDDVHLEEAINDILEIPTLDGESTKATKLGTLSKERKTESRKKVDMFESRGTDTKTPTAKAFASPAVKLPRAKDSYSSVETKNCHSGSSVASGDSMRPMAAGSSRMTSVGCLDSPNTVTLPFSNTTRQVPKRRQALPAILKKENTVRKSRMTDSKETAVPTLGLVNSMAIQRKPAVPVTGLNSHRTASGITYESDEVMLMEQIARESLRL